MNTKTVYPGPTVAFPSVKSRPKLFTHGTGVELEKYMRLPKGRGCWGCWGVARGLDLCPNEDLACRQTPPCEGGGYVGVDTTGANICICVRGHDSVACVRCLVVHLS